MKICWYGPNAGWFKGERMKSLTLADNAYVPPYLDFDILLGPDELARWACNEEAVLPHPVREHYVLIATEEATMKEQLCIICHEPLDDDGGLCETCGERFHLDECGQGFSGGEDEVLHFCFNCLEE